MKTSAIRRWGQAAIATTAIAAGMSVGAGQAVAAPARSVTRALGLVVDRQAHLSIGAAFRVRAAAAALPSAVDLTPFAPPVGNQGPVGSCAAWSSDYTAMGYWLRKDNRTASGFLEPMYTYAQVDGGADNGSSIDANLQVAATQGVDVRSDYVQGDFDWADQPTTHERANATNWKLSSYAELPVVPGQSITQQSIETALAAGDPVVIGIPVYYNFEEVTSANSGWYDTVSGPLLGYHAITALGYSSTGLRIENSWTTGWGDSGFATLSWGFVNNYVDEAVSVANLIPVNSTPAPTVTSESPTAVSAAGGTSVTLVGAYLTGATVTVGATSATITANTGSSLTFTAPAEPTGSTTVSVSTQSGVATTSLSYIPAPVVTSESPTVGNVTGGTSVTLAGSNLTGATVTVGGTAARIVSQSATSVTFVTPAGSAGNTTVTVTTPVGAARTSFTFVAAPIVVSEAPVDGGLAGGTKVTIAGTNLGGAVVTIGGLAVTNTSSASTSVVFTAPAHPAVANTPLTVVTVTITTVGGSASIPFIYAVIPS